MRAFLAESTIPIYLLFSFIGIVTLLFFYANYHVRKKFSEIDSAGKVFKWHQLNVFFLYVAWPLILLPLFSMIYSANGGWILDGVAWIFGLLGLMLPIGLLSLKWTIISDNSIIFINAFTANEEYPYDSIDLLQVIKEKRTVKSIVQYVYELKFYTPDTSFEISEHTNDMIELIELLTQKIEESKIEYVDKTDN